MRSAAVINNGLRRYVALNLFIEYVHQGRVIAGVYIMTIFIVYTLVYTIFSRVPPIW
ncbi:Uncharacterised protein [Escherichia coli]|jgi:hypothetical protein|uniref:Uncharacterized protein n=1 Tax=Escherichia coli TaxID=562 RepID=A0A376VTM0_ECOLX|nr:Uncharacterised protein [Escherichia coli]